MQMYTLRVAKSPTGKEGFDDFIQYCIERMSADDLRSSVSYDKRGKLYEAQYQKQFYAAATSYLPAGYCISPEVGQVSCAQRKL